MRRKRKSLIAVVFVMILFLLPSQAFAGTQTEYRTDGGEKIGYKKITVDDTTFKDVNETLGGELTKANESKLASGIIGQWSPVAVDVFDSDTSVWGARNAPTYINSLMLNFEESFKHSGNETDRKIDLKAWLADPEPRKIDTDSQMKSTGLKKENSIPQLRKNMAAHIQECLEDVYGEGNSAMTADAILNAQYDKLPDHKALDGFLEKTGRRDVYYSIVTSINKSNTLGVPCAYYNSYAIAVYDVTLSPVIAESKDALEYVQQEDKGSVSQTEEDDYIGMINDTGNELTTNVKQDNSRKQTMANNMNARDDRIYPFADPVGDSHWNELPFLDTIGSKLLRSTDPVKAMNSTGNDPYTNEENNSSYINVTMPADTCQVVHRTSTKAKTTAAYTAPYAIEYKVLVFSLNGEIRHPADASKLKHFNFGDYYAFFDKNTTGSVENLALRTSDDARHSSTYENNYGDTLGCVKDTNHTSTKIRWFDKTMGFVDDGGNPDHSGGHYTSSIVGRQKDNIDKIVKSDRMLTSGYGTMVLETKRVESKAYDDLEAAYPLTQVTTAWQHETGKELLHIRLNNNRAWNLGAVAVQAYNDRGNPYYGFDGSPFGGDWVVCDENGTEIDPSESPLRIMDTRTVSGEEKTGTQILLTEDEGVGYIRWKIKNNIFYENAVEPVLGVGRDNTPSKPIEIEIIPPADPDDAQVELVPDGDLSIPAGEELDLNKHIVTQIRSGDETDVIPGRFFFKDSYTDAQISPEGVFSAQRAGTYEVWGAMMVDETTFGLTSKNSVTVTVTAKRAPDSIIAKEPAEGELSPTCSKVGYDLLSLVSVEDNYGEPWDGKGTFDFNFSGGGKTIAGKASINAGDGRPCLIINSPGTYNVVASYKEDDVSLKKTITFKVHQIIGIPDPVPVKNLTYNGEPQTGVVAEEGCLLTGEKATEAGRYKAIAAPAEGYAWLDGSTDEKEIPYVIHEAWVEKPTAADLVYNGEVQTAVAAGFGYTVEGGTAKDVGSYTATAKLLPSCRWDDGTRGDIILKYTVTAAPEPKPTPAKVSGTPLAKATAKGKKSLSLSWSKVDGAEGYDIFFARCDHKKSKNTCKNVKTITGNETFKWTKSGLKKGTPYKFYVRAYVYSNGQKTYVSKSPEMHAYTGGYTKKYTNARSIKLKNVKKGELSLEKGGTFRIKAKVNKVKKNKKLMPKGHAPKLRYMTSDSSIAAVSNNGRITAIGEGTCTVYVLAHNGVSKSIKVVVK